MKNLKHKKLISIIAVALVIVILSALLYGCGFFGGYGETALMELMTELATSMFTGDGLSVNILLENPENLGLDNQPAKLPVPNFNKEEYEEGMRGLADIAKVLKQINYDKLSTVGKCDYDTVVDYFTTYSQYADFYYLDNRDYIGVNDGWNVLLPLYLDKLAFKTENDVKNWIDLVNQTATAFPEYVKFEKEVLIPAGYGRSKASYEGIEEQCRNIVKVEEGEEHFLIGLFEDKMAAVTFLSAESSASYISQAKDAVNNRLIPAYISLADGVKELIPTSGNGKTLAEYAEGKAYYELLFKDTASTSDSVDTAYQNLTNAFNATLTEIRTLATEVGDVELPTDFSAEAIKGYYDTLKAAYTQDFPALPSSIPDATFHKVPDAMSEFYNPASYFKSAVDSTSAPETIYINEANAGGYYGFDIISHEGIPGHMLQHAYYKSTGANMLRTVLGYTGYAEGWASYAQYYAGKYFVGTEEQKQAYKLMCLEDKAVTYVYTLLDIEINYKGKSLAELQSHEFFGNYISERAYDYMLENPAVYASYGYGNYKMEELRAGFSGSDFDFHKGVLSVGPTTYEILKKYL